MEDDDALTPIKDLAKLAGVSVTTVSRALNGYDDVSKDTRMQLGYRHALVEYGVAFREDLIFNGEFKEEGGYAAMHQILNLHPEVTAVFSASDLMVLGALRALEHLGLKSPENMSIVGYDDMLSLRTARHQ